MAALLFAAQQGDVESANVLLKAGANVNDTASSGMSVLVLAAHSGHTSLATLLLDNGANPDANGAGYSALHAAVLNGSLQLVRTLLRHGANPNVPITKATPARRYSADLGFGENLTGATPFYLAAKFGEIEILRELIAGGADPQLAAADGSTASMMALDTPTTRAGGIGGFGADRRDRYVFVHLINAQTLEEIEDEALAILRETVQLGCAVGLTDMNGNSVLHLAAAKGFHRVIQFLIDKGAHVNARNKLGQTALSMVQGGTKRRGDDQGVVAAATAALLRSLGAVD